MRTVDKPKKRGKRKMNYQNQENAAVSGQRCSEQKVVQRGLGTLGLGTAIQASSSPSPLLNQLLSRFEQVNANMGERVNMLASINDHILGESPSTANEKIDCGPGTLAQIEYQIRISEQILSRMANEVDRLSRL